MRCFLKFNSTKHTSSLCRPRPNICPKQTNYCPWSEVELLVQISKLTLETSLLCPFYWGSYQRGPGYKFWVSMSISILCHRNQPFETNQNTLTTRTVKINLQLTLVILVVDHLDSFSILQGLQSLTMGLQAIVSQGCWLLLPFSRLPEMWRKIWWYSLIDTATTSHAQ